MFVWWEGGARVRLGELGVGATRTFTTPLRDAAVWLSLDVLSQGTGRRDRPDSFVPVLLITSGDRIEWEVRRTSPIDLCDQDVYRRLTSFSGDIGSQEPRTTRYTAISQMRIAEAQGVEDASLRALAYREALTAINDGLAEENDNPMSFLHLGIVNTGLKDYVGAGLAFDQAEALYPDYVDDDAGTGAYRFNAWLDAYNDATLRLDEQDAEGAVELFRMANMVYGNRVEAYLNLGSSLAGLGDMEGSIEAWRSAIAVIESPDGNPGDDVTRETWDAQYWILAHSNLGLLLPTVGRPEEAVVVLETILERYPDNVEARSSLAMALSQSGQGDDALGIFDEILASEDAPPLDYFNVGVSLYGADQMDRAVLAFEKTIARSPMYRDAFRTWPKPLICWRTTRPKSPTRRSSSSWTLSTTTPI